MNPEDRVRDLFRGAEENRTASEGEWADFSRRAHRRLAVRRFAAGAGAAALVAAGVVGFTVVDFGGDESSPAPAVSSTESEQPTPDTSPTPVVTVPDTIQELWFVKDGKLIPTGITPVV